MQERDDKVSISIRLGSAVHKRLTEVVEQVGGSLNGEIQRRLALSFEAEARQEELRNQLTRMEHQLNAVALALLGGQVAESKKRKG
jgi:ABC-type uncharacterized transport system fused permease/ATPase subunit